MNILSRVKYITHALCVYIYNTMHTASLLCRNWFISCDCLHFALAILLLWIADALPQVVQNLPGHLHMDNSAPSPIIEDSALKIIQALFRDSWQGHLEDPGCQVAISHVRLPAPLLQALTTLAFIQGLAQGLITGFLPGSQHLSHVLAIHSGLVRTGLPQVKAFSCNELHKAPVPLGELEIGDAINSLLLWMPSFISELDHHLILKREGHGWRSGHSESQGLGETVKPFKSCSGMIYMHASCVFLEAVLPERVHGI